MMHSNKTILVEVKNLHMTGFATLNLVTGFKERMVFMLVPISYFIESLDKENKKFEVNDPHVLN